MDIKEYQEYVRAGASPAYDQHLALLGLVGEIGELCEAGNATVSPMGTCLKLESYVGQLCDVIKKVHIYLDMSKFEKKYGMTAEEKIKTLTIQAREQIDNLESVKDFFLGVSDVYTPEMREEVKSECGDCLWQLALVLCKYDLTFDEVINYNVEKLNARHGGAGKTAVDGGGVR